MGSFLENKSDKRRVLCSPQFLLTNYVKYDIIIWRENKIPEEIIEHAKQECETMFSADGKIYSIKGMLTLVTMLEGRYSKSLVNEVINETYQKLLEELDIHSKPEIPFYNTDSPKMEELCKLLAEYSKVVNPFGSEKKLKAPINYLNKGIKLMLNNKDNTQLNLVSESVYALFMKEESGWMYYSKYPIKNGKLTLDHWYVNGTDDEFPLDEVIELCYYEPDGDDVFSLTLSLKTGLAWENNEEENAKPATDAQIKTIIDCLKISIKEIQRNIVDYMICDN